MIFFSSSQHSSEHDLLFFSFLSLSYISDKLPATNPDNSATINLKINIGVPKTP